MRVIYCAEPFENDGTPVATIVKSVKRAIAGEYRRSSLNGRQLSNEEMFAALRGLPRASEMQSFTAMVAQQFTAA